MKLSIITVNLNNAVGLQKTFNSVFNQTFKNFEYIVIDGGSIDGSVAIIKQYIDKISYWVSEPDKGIYNAMNKGILNAKGEYLLFLNSGDLLFSEQTLALVFSIADKVDNDIIYGNIMLQGANNSLTPYNYPSIVEIDYLLKYALPHQACYIKRTLFQKNGLYSENFKIVSDWEWILKCFLFHRISYKHLQESLAIYDVEGVSFAKENTKLIEDEKRSVLKTIFSNQANEFIDLYYKYKKFYTKTTAGFFYKYIYTVPNRVYSKFNRILLRKLHQGRVNKKKLKNKDFTLIANNCVGGIIYSDYNLKFTSPTINLYFYAFDYIEFLENLNYYLEQPLKYKFESRFFNKHLNYPVGYWGIIEVHFLHYNSVNEANEKWEERKKRINFKNIFIIGSDRDGCTPEIIKRFDRLPFSNKLFFSAKNYPEYKSVVHIDCYNGQESVGDMIKNRTWLNYVNLNKWFNSKKISRYNFRKKIYNYFFPEISK